MISDSQSARQTGLARALSKLGYCSRSQAFGLIRAGRVRLNGRLVRDPEKPVLPGKDRIEVDGNKIGQAGMLYLMLNKPRGVVTTARDEKGRKTVYSLLPNYTEKDWLAPVGRLDMASEGLLLLTNDSAWGARISSPEAHIEKTYHVQIGAIAGKELVDRLQKSVRTAEGDFLGVKRASVLRLGKKNSWLEIVLDEGKNRHIRRMLSELGIDVLRLVRVAIGPVRLGDLPKGKARPLTNEEKKALAGQN
ncbi:MAG: Pseudouridine synthase, Rsu [Acidobacteriaceae bacterium]|nr:Pseudouridine synthase, Rsu [Acidobacteriaceae bacterium]